VVGGTGVALGVAHALSTMLNMTTRLRTMNDLLRMCKSPPAECIGRLDQMADGS